MVFNPEAMSVAANKAEEEKSPEQEQAAEIYHEIDMVINDAAGGRWKKIADKQGEILSDHPGARQVLEEHGTQFQRSQVASGVTKFREWFATAKKELETKGTSVVEDGPMTEGLSLNYVEGVQKVLSRLSVFENISTE